MKLWAGRFSKGTAELADKFNCSLPFDKKMFREDITGSMAHAKMLAKTGIITEEEFASLSKGLSRIMSDIENGTLPIEGAEDIHSFVELELTKRIGDVGKKLHTARSRNDQVALDLRLYTKNCLLTLKARLVSLIKTLCTISRANLETYMPAFTHMQKAQPVTLAHHLTAYSEMLLRDIARVDFAISQADVSPLGSGALAGTTFPIDREYTAKLLNMRGVTENSLDGVSDRDFALDALYACSLIMMHLSRFSEEIITWASDEYRFIRISDEYSTGSSIMPQKKNPDMAELIRGKTGRVYGDLMGLLTVMKGLPLAYNKDMQEDKEGLFDALDTAIAATEITSAMIGSSTFNGSKMAHSAASGYTNATDVADYLAKKGLPFRDAHFVSGRITMYAEQNGITIEAIPLDKLKEFSPLFENDVYEKISLAYIVSQRSCVGGPAPAQVSDTIARILAGLEN